MHLCLEKIWHWARFSNHVLLSCVFEWDCCFFMNIPVSRMRIASWFLWLASGLSHDFLSHSFFFLQIVVWDGVEDGVELSWSISVSRPSLEQARRMKQSRIYEKRTKRHPYWLLTLGAHRDRDDGIGLPCTSVFHISLRKPTYHSLFGSNFLGLVQTYSFAHK